MHAVHAVAAPADVFIMVWIFLAQSFYEAALHIHMISMREGKKELILLENASKGGRKVA